MKRLRLIIAALLTLALTVGMFAALGGEKAQAASKTLGLSDPKITIDSETLSKKNEYDIVTQSGQNVTYDCVWFGTYPQAEIVPSKADYKCLDEDYLHDEDLIEDAELYKKLSASKDFDKDGVVKINGERYIRIKHADTTRDSGRYKWDDNYHYFKFQPLKGRVLKVNGDEALLLADKVLDARSYFRDIRVSSIDEFDGYLPVSRWADSDMRSYLNGYPSSENSNGIDYTKGNSFLDAAFSADELKVIKETKLTGADNPEYGTSGGDDTVDKVFLLSLNEVYGDKADAFGFVKREDNARETFDEAKRATVTAFAWANGIINVDSAAFGRTGTWWLRSPGSGDYDDDGEMVACVFGGGYVYDSGDDGYWSQGVRPALTVSILDTGIVKAAGTTDSLDAFEGKKPYGFEAEDKDLPAPTINLVSGKTYKKTKSVTIYSEAGLESIKLNSKQIKVTEGKKKIKFKLSKYASSLKKKGKKNTLTITDINGNIVKIIFKTK